MKAGQITFRSRILRKQSDLPRYIVVLPEHVQGRTQSFPADIFLNDAGPFRRNVHPWGKGSAAYFFNLTVSQCKQADLDTDDECHVTIKPLPV